MRKQLYVAAALACSPLSAVYATEININPLGLIIGSLNGNALFTLTEDETTKVGPSFGYLGLDLGDVKLTATTIGVRFEKSTATQGYDDGAFFAANAGYTSLTVEETDSYSSTNCEATATGLTATGLVGYGWYFDNGFSSRVAGGYTVGNLDIEAQCDNEAETAAEAYGGLALEWTLGFRF
ncbi:hypothetical protein [Saccharospirillum salsuginis]|uniref:Outer membrane protein beta-barrel domain-containing protein n=1 Tax=Saccharospirillum salsuginis TaxID=418750 RepID=A0A918K3W4_9GAMM|nr:hypothetical protein [Saccharospirillum salsuginis]GGX42776.1 hypothetical protein GCM10007392_06700 [Saccharospirillum salsuginis]